MPLSAVAKVLAPSPVALQVSVFDGAHVPAVLKAIDGAELQISTEVQGRIIRLAVPRPTTEAREALAKQVRRAAEHAKTVLRSARQGAMKQAKALPSKDEARRAEKEIQRVLDEHVAKVDAAAAAKEKEVLAV